jgi:hypothetical protein
MHLCTSDIIFGLIDLGTQNNETAMAECKFCFKQSYIMKHLKRLQNDYLSYVILLLSEQGICYDTLRVTICVHHQNTNPA